MEVITLDTGRRAFEVKRGSEVSKWEYDVLTIKLEFEQLEARHSLRTGNKLAPPTSAFLADVAGMLSTHGLEGCSVDVAYRVYSVVTAQFNAMAIEVEKQAANAVKAT